MAHRGPWAPCLEPCWLCEENDEPHWSHGFKQREQPHQEHICRGCLDEIGDQLKLSAEIKALRTQAQAHEDRLDSLRAQMEEMKTMLKSLPGYIQRMGGGHEQTSPDRVQKSVRRVLCIEHF